MVHKYEMRVRYSDTDQMQRLHHAAFIEYLEVVRIEFLRSAGIGYDAIEKSGYLLPVSALQISYRQGAAFDEVILFETTLELKSDVRICFTSNMFVEQSLIAEATVELACIDANRYRPTRLPEHVRSVLQACSIQTESVG